MNKVKFTFNKHTLSVLISASISLLIFILGIIVLCSAGKLAESIYVGTTYASSYSFGADFYTEMFKITYKAVDQLNNIGNGIASGFGRVLTSLRVIAKGVGVLIMALGLFSLNRSVPALVELLPEKPAVKTEPVQDAAAEETLPEAEAEAEEQPGEAASEESAETI